MRDETTTHPHSAVPIKIIIIPPEYPLNTLHFNYLPAIQQHQLWSSDAHLSDPTQPTNELDDGWNIARRWVAEARRGVEDGNMNLYRIIRPKIGFASTGCPCLAVCCRMRAFHGVMDFVWILSREREIESRVFERVNLLQLGLWKWWTSALHVVSNDHWFESIFGLSAEKTKGSQLNLITCSGDN